MRKVRRVIKISLFTNMSLVLIKIVFGFIGKSSTLIADGIHSFSDLITDLIAIFGNGISRKPADAKHPYGHGRSEYITSLIIGFMVLGAGIGIIYETMHKEIIIPSVFVLFISFLTIIIKLILARYVVKKGNEYNNSILIASGKESSADVLSSIVVLISIFLMQLSEYSVIFKYADIIGTVIVGLFIIKTGYEILKDSISIILGEQETDEEFLQKIKNIILKEEKVKEIKSLIVIKYGPYYKLIGEVVMDNSLSLIEAHNIIDNIETGIKKKLRKIAYITFHMCPYVDKK